MNENERGTEESKEEKKSSLFLLWFQGLSRLKKILFVVLLSLIFASSILIIADVIPNPFNYILGTSIIQQDSQEHDGNDTHKIIESNSDAILDGGLLGTSIKDEQARLNAIAENSRVHCIISSAPYFPSPSEKGTLAISNPEESLYYLQVEIKTIDTEETMYISPLLAPDQSIHKDYLSDKGFIKGEYPATAIFHYYSKTGTSGTNEDYTYIGSMSAEIQMNIG